MKSCILKIPHAGICIEVIESPLLAKPWPDEKGVMAYRAMANTDENKLYVHNIYAFAFGLLGITDGARMCCAIAKKRLETLIDNMATI